MNGHFNTKFLLQIFFSFVLIAGCDKKPEDSEPNSDEEASETPKPVSVLNRIADLNVGKEDAVAYLLFTGKVYAVNSSGEVTKAHEDDVIHTSPFSSVHFTEESVYLTANVCNTGSYDSCGCKVIQIKGNERFCHYDGEFEPATINVVGDRIFFTADDPKDSTNQAESIFTVADGELVQLVESEWGISSIYGFTDGSALYSTYIDDLGNQKLAHVDATGSTNEIFAKFKGSIHDNIVDDTKHLYIAHTENGNGDKNIYKFDIATGQLITKPYLGWYTASGYNTIEVDSVTGAYSGYLEADTMYISETIDASKIVIPESLTDDRSSATTKWDPDTSRFVLDVDGTSREYIYAGGAVFRYDNWEPYTFPFSSLESPKKILALDGVRVAIESQIRDENNNVTNYYQLFLSGGGQSSNVALDIFPADSGHELLDHIYLPNEKRIVFTTTKVIPGPTTDDPTAYEYYVGTYHLDSGATPLTELILAEGELGWSKSPTHLQAKP
jgi:hypothetical protein